MIRLCCVLAQVLRAGLGWGQQQFQLLLQESPASGAADGQSEAVCLEELRYRWMLHKSKLKDVGDLKSRKSAMVGYVVGIVWATWWQCCTTALTAFCGHCGNFDYHSCHTVIVIFPICAETPSNKRGGSCCDNKSSKSKRIDS